MILRIENVSFSYPSNPVFENITFEVVKGDFLGILGPNGCGKSTILKLIDRILVPQSGRIKVKEKQLNDYHRKDIAKCIGFVPQGIHWQFPFSVFEVVLMGRIPHSGGYGFESEQDIEIAREAMRSVDILRLAEKPITGVSGGEQQRALIARALAQKPEILLLDEPNAHLDIAHQIEIFQILKEENDQNDLTVICVSHDLNLASSFSKRLMMLGSASSGESRERYGGNKIVAIGSPSEVLTNEHIERVFSTPVMVDPHPISGSPRITIRLIEEIEEKGD